MSLLRAPRAAIVFFTRVPAGGFPYHDAEWRRAAGWFPLVGVVVGLLAAGVWLLARPLGAAVAATMAVTATILVTGGLHEDGLADTADALGGASDRGRLFEILKDPRVGTFGVLALLLSLLFRVLLLTSLPADAATALVLSHCAARLPPVWLMATQPYVTPRRLARSGAVASATWREVWVAAAVVVLTVLLLIAGKLVSPVAAAAATLSPLAVSVALGRVFRRRAGGVTGDFLGATEQAGEVVALLAIAVTGILTA